MNISRKKRLLLFLLAALASSCSDSPATYVHHTKNTAGSSGMVAHIPSRIAQSRAIDRSRLYATLVVNGSAQRLDQSTGIHTSFDIALGDTVTAQVNWFETLVTDEELLLASWSVTQIVTGNLHFVVNADDYTTTGDQFDSDGDGVSNLDERINGTYPSDVGGTAIAPATVLIPFIDGVDAPIIDGLYDESYTLYARFTDVNGEQLSIDNRLINQGAIRADGSTEFIWFGMHDDTYLYLMVLTENVELANVIRDSTDVWQDDSISVYIDGDNSKNGQYDGINDRHFVIPLLTATDQQSSNNSVFVAGINSAALPEFEFATCFCTSGQHAFEMKISLSEFGIGFDSPFGFDIHVDLDHDGGARDAKWSWFRPSVGDTDIDDSWMDPSVFGTVILE